MNVEALYSLVSLILALSIASERLVEIVKNLITPLNRKYDDPRKEGYRQAAVQLLAVASGLFTTYLAQKALPSQIAGLTDSTRIVALGLLASGGSSFWNSILTYLVSVKNIQGAKAAAMKSINANNLIPTVQPIVVQEGQNNGQQGAPALLSGVSVRI